MIIRRVLREEIIKLCNADIKVLKKIYPDVAHYLEEFGFDNEELAQYFNEYKSQKLRNEITPDFQAKIDKYAREKGKWLTYGFLPRNEVIRSVYHDNYILCWIDGLGVEYCSFIKNHIILKYPHLCVDIKIAYANIPTVLASKRRECIKGKFIL